MTIKALIQTLRRAALCSCVAFTFAVAAVPARADNPPKTKDADVTAFVQKMSDNFDAMLEAVKAKDEPKIKEYSAKLDALMKEGDPLKSKVTPEEDAAIDKWFAEQMKRLVDAGFKFQ